MRIALAQINVHVGNFEKNSEKIISHIRKAMAEKADIIVFPELAICGYPSRDFLDYKDFTRRCENAVQKIAAHCTDIACIIGSPSFNSQIEGKDLFNSAYFLYDGKIQKIIHKTLLPTYDIFDEYRHFEPNRKFECIDFKGKKIALTICEDLWNIDENPLYVSSPMDELIKQKPDLMINIAASPFDYLHAERRQQMLSDNCKKYKLPLFYVNHIGAQTELIFDGGSLVMNAKGEVVEKLAYFEEELRITNDEFAPWSDVGSQKSDLQPPTSDLRPPMSEVERIGSALILGVRDYFEKSGFKKAILGLSGGIDSAVVCALAVRALGKENVLGVLMPSKFSSDHSVKDAVTLAHNLEIHYELISIENAFDQFEKTLHPVFNDLPKDLTEENLQARIRGVLLMALSNKFGNILLNTSNKSEAAVGYGTLYGDMCGGISVIGDVYKTRVYELADFINKDSEIIPQNTITKPPSAELRYDQKDSDSLPEYDILDKVLFEYIENQKSPDEIIASGYDEKLVSRITGLVNRNEYKRYQTPPVLRVSPKAFGMGRRMPIVAKY
jgi:NAD+ synthase (glutamine-hydrolysing)